MASTALAQQSSQTVELVPYVKTINLNTQCNNRNQTLEDKYGLTPPEINKFNTYQTKIAEESQKIFHITPQQYVNYNICMEKITTYSERALSEIKASKKPEQQHAKAQAALAILQKVHDACRNEVNPTIPESYDKFLEEHENLVVAPLERKFTPSLEKADADLDIPSINICNAIKDKTLSKKDARVTQFRPK
jgi:hypothetical protein